MLLAVQPNIMRITKNPDRNSTEILNLFIKQFHVIPLKWLLWAQQAAPLLFHNQCLINWNNPCQLRKSKSKYFFRIGCWSRKLRLQKKNSKNKFPLLNTESSKSISSNLVVPFMNKLRRAAEHRPARADNYLEKSFTEYHIAFQLIAQMKCIMAARV